MIISAVQQSDSVLHGHTSILSDSFPTEIITESWVGFPVLDSRCPLANQSFHIPQSAYANSKPPVHPSHPTPTPGSGNSCLGQRLRVQSPCRGLEAPHLVPLGWATSGKNSKALRWYQHPLAGLRRGWGWGRLFLGPWDPATATAL